MRFCPFCGAENQDDAQKCAACARKLPAAVVRRPTTAAALPPAPASAATPPATATPGPVAPRGASPSPPPLPPVLPAPRRSGSAPAVAGTPPPPDGARAASTPLPVAAVISPDARTANGTPAGKVATRAASAITPSTLTPTPTPIGREATESALVTRLMSLPEVESTRQSLSPMPAVPDGGPIEAARYTVLFVRARWQRARVIKSLSGDVTQETALFDALLSELGKTSRSLHLEGRVFADENQGLDEAERRRGFAEQACADLTAKKAEENAKYEAIQHDLAARLSEREESLKTVSAELERLEGTRRGLRDRKKDVDKKQKAIHKSAAEREDQAAKSQMGDARAALRETASELRREASKLEAEKEDVDQRLAGLEKPLSDVQGRHDLAKSDHEAARRDLENAREGHRHRLAEIEAEQARKSRELLQADSEIARRLVTLGTILNLNRVEKPELADLYERADKLRAAIGAREAEIDRLNAERDGYDRTSLVTGGLVLGGTLLSVIILIWVLIAVL